MVGESEAKGSIPGVNPASAAPDDAPVVHVAEDAGRGRLLHTWNYDYNGDRLGATYLELALAHGYDHSWEGHWTTDEPDLGPIGRWTVVASRETQNGTSRRVLVREGAVAELRFSAPDVTLALAASSQALRDTLVGELRRDLPESVPGPDAVSVGFWSHGDSGASSLPRSVATPSFAEIADNYPEPVRVEMARLLDPQFTPGAGGRLLLWHGPAGVGKTHALRALIRGWRSWCDVSYIADVDAFFGDASYLMRVLLYVPSGGRRDVPAGDRRREWHLVVLEDAGEFLSRDGANRAGQGFSRLLNVTDGLLGQGLHVLLLITTNEEIGRLHPAVSRPGRCASRLAFEPLDRASAQRWLREHGVAAEVSGPQTLAALYALAEGRDQREPPRRVGFHTDGGTR